MKNSFSPSINLIRDQRKQIDYIVTPNAENVLEQLNNKIQAGIKSFYIVGSFGTGKSAFLLALEKQLSYGEKIFKIPVVANSKLFYEPINIIGDFQSIGDAFRKALKIRKDQDIIDELEKHYKKLHSNKKGLLILIDEFGKFLEHCIKYSPEKELYLIQRLAEFVNDSDKNILFITTLHQGFDFYRSQADVKIKNEWDKVRGRFQEITFNEPVEQLLYLAAEFRNGRPDTIAAKEIQELHSSLVKSRILAENSGHAKDLARKIFPLDYLAGVVLTKALQRYGQNERSLFTFLQATDFEKYTNGNLFFNLSTVFDYLNDNFYTLLTSKFNPDFFRWTIIRNSLERMEALLPEESKSAKSLIKTIGLMNIFMPAGVKIDAKFLQKYGRHALEINKVLDVLQILETKKIIRYQAYAERYILFEGTDVDIDKELLNAENHLPIAIDIVAKINEYFNFLYVPARASYIKTGTPRFFEYVISETPTDKKPEKEVDGIINLIFNNSVGLDEIKQISKKNQDAVLFAVYKNAGKITDTLREIEKINIVLLKTLDDRIAQRELKNLREYQVLELNQLVVSSLFDTGSHVSWVFHGEEYKINTKSDFTKLISFIMEEVYPCTPIFKNELVNKEKLPAAITSARKNLLVRLLKQVHEKDLGYSGESFPPDRTIYLSLLYNTKMHREDKESKSYGLYEPVDESLKAIWNESEKFLEQSKSGKKSIQELFEVLSRRPFKAKKGFLDFWVPIFLLARQDDYAFFDGDVFLPGFTEDLSDLIIRYPHKYYCKAFDIKGPRLKLFNRYRYFLNVENQEKASRESFINTIRPFLAFYRGLPEYAKTTNRLSKNAIALRNSIANAKDLEKTFFEDFPIALGYTTIGVAESDASQEKFIKDLQDTVREIRTSYDFLVNRIEAFICESLGVEHASFEKYKELLIHRIQSAKKHLLLPGQATFAQRVSSALNDKNAWLGSIAHVLVGKQLEQINDDEEKQFYEGFTRILKEFDNLADFSNLEIDETSEDVVRIEINRLHESPQTDIIRIPKNIKKQSVEVEKQIVSYLEQNNLDAEQKKYVLSRILKDLM